VQRAVGQVRDLIGEPEAGPDRVVEALEGWLSRDEKVTPLKTLQGLIWADGFARGDLTAHFYDDAVPALRRWHDAGLRLYVFSSGSLTAQATWFGTARTATCCTCSPAASTPRTPGPSGSPRRTPPSARDRRGPRAHGVPVGPRRRAGRRPEAGWQTVGVRRPGEPYYDRGVGDHPEVASFDEVEPVRA
jgi:enolase-phosphatase E1